MSARDCNRSRYRPAAIACALAACVTPALAKLPYGAQPRDQSAFALGSMTLNVVFVESDGQFDPNENDWSPGQLAKLQSEIGEAKTYWESLTAGFHPNARLSLNVNYVNGGAPVPTGYEPISRPRSAETQWVANVMSNLGYSSGAYNARVQAMNNATRAAAGTNWAATLFVVNDLSSDTHTFTDGDFAFTRYGGPYALMTYNNADWGADHFGMVLSHEMAHLFFAIDEYAGAGETSDATAGYLGAANANSQLGPGGQPRNPAQPNALMLNVGNTATDKPYAPSPSTLAQIGLRDADGDGVPDILDTKPTISGAADGSDPLAGVFKFTGSTAVTTLANENPIAGFSSSLSDMTIDTIAAAYWSLDGGAPQPFAPGVDPFGDYTKTLDLTLAGLAEGLHTIDIWSVNSVDIASDKLRYSINVIPEPAAPACAATALLLVRRRRA